MDSLNTAEQDLQRTTNRVCEAMMVEVNGFTSPISKVIDHDYGELEGTGSYVEIVDFWSRTSMLPHVDHSTL